MADQYDFSAFDNAVKKQESASPEKYDLSAFDNANKIEEQPGALSRMLSDAGESAANLGKGITQGVTLGAAPYIAGAIGTPISYALGTASPEGLEETFKQNVAGAKKTLEPTSQESILQKLLYKGGELGGGIIPFEATAAMGLGAKSVRGAMGAGEQVALKEAAAQGGIKGLSKELGTRFIAGAPQGAVLGGGAAAIQGESAQDIGESALTGGLISGAAGMAGLGAKNKETSAPEKLGPPELSNKVDVTPSSPTMAQIKEGWKQGYEEGRFLSTDKGAKPLREEVISATEDLAKRTSNVDNELSENIGKILDSTKKPVSITEPFNSLAKKVEELRTKNVFAEQKRLMNLKSKFDVFSQYSADIVSADNPSGKFSKRYAMTKFFGWTDEEYQLNEEWIKEENAINQETTSQEPTQPEESSGEVSGQQELSTANQEGGGEAEPPEEPVNDGNEKGEPSQAAESDFGLP